MDDDRLELLAEIASLYFEESVSQADIAKRTGYSRSMVSRLLTEARKQGLVEIRVRHPVGRRIDLEHELQDALGLKVVRVVMRATLDDVHMLRRLGSMAARLVEELVEDNMTVGVAWGPAVYETVYALRSGTHTGVHVVQMIGSIGTPDPQIDGQDLARRLARTFVGHFTTLPVPLFVESESTRESLMREPQIRRAMDQFRHIQLALVGVGTLDPNRSTMLRTGYLTLKQLEELRQAGAVGDVCGVYFDLYGKLIDVPMTRRTVGIDAGTVVAIPMKIGVAGGESKIAPIIGASRAKFIDILATDEIAATGIIHELKGKSVAVNELRAKSGIISA